jgi:iron(III) transport system substrate-binding protein
VSQTSIGKGIIAIALIVGLLVGGLAGYFLKSTEVVEKVEIVEVPVGQFWEKPDPNGELAQAARNEGKVVLYHNQPEWESEIIQNELKEIYGIDVEVWRGSGTKVYEKIRAEYQSDTHVVDVFQTAPLLLEQMAKDGMCKAIDLPPDLQGILDPKSLVQAPYGFIPNNAPLVFVYNTELLSEEETPSSFEEWADPKWKGMITLGDPTVHTTTAQWFYTLKNIWGEEKWLEWVEALKEQELYLQSSLTPCAQVVAIKERAMGLTYITSAIAEVEKGAPIKMKIMPTAVGSPTIAGVYSEAPNPNAARLLLLWLLSSTYQEQVKSKTSFPMLAYVEPDFPPEVTVVPNTEIHPIEYFPMEYPYREFADELGVLLGLI